MFRFVLFSSRLILLILFRCVCVCAWTLCAALLLSAVFNCFTLLSSALISSIPPPTPFEQPPPRLSFLCLPQIHPSFPSAALIYIPSASLLCIPSAALLNTGTTVDYSYPPTVYPPALLPPPRFCTRFHLSFRQFCIRLHLSFCRFCMRSTSASSIVSSIQRFYPTSCLWIRPLDALSEKHALSPFELPIPAHTKDMLKGCFAPHVFHV